jgi:hypothetical protein
MFQNKRVNFTLYSLAILSSLIIRQVIELSYKRNINFLVSYFYESVFIFIFFNKNYFNDIFNHKRKYGLVVGNIKRLDSEIIKYYSIASLYSFLFLIIKLLRNVLSYYFNSILFTTISLFKIESFNFFKNEISTLFVLNCLKLLFFSVLAFSAVFNFSFLGMSFLILFLILTGIKNRKIDCILQEEKTEKDIAQAFTFNSINLKTNDANDTNSTRQCLHPAENSNSPTNSSDFNYSFDLNYSFDCNNSSPHQAINFFNLLFSAIFLFYFDDFSNIFNKRVFFIIFSYFLISIFINFILMKISRGYSREINLGFGIFIKIFKIVLNGIRRKTEIDSFQLGCVMSVGVTTYLIKKIRK